MKSLYRCIYFNSLLWFIFSLWRWLREGALTWHPTNIFISNLLEISHIKELGWNLTPATKLFESYWRSFWHPQHNVAKYLHVDECRKYWVFESLPFTFSDPPQIFIIHEEFKQNGIGENFTHSLKIAHYVMGKYFWYSIDLWARNKHHMKTDNRAGLMKNQVQRNLPEFKYL